MLVAAAITLWGGAPCADAAGGAYGVDTADVSEAGSCKVESWNSIADNKDAITAVNPACVVDLFRPVELSTQISRSRASDDLSSSFAPKAKTAPAAAEQPATEGKGA